MWNRAIKVGVLCLAFAVCTGASEVRAETKSYQIRVLRADLQSRDPKPWEGVALKSIEAQAPARREDFNCAPRSDAKGIIECQVTCYKGGNRVRRYYDVELEESVNHNAERRQNIAVSECNFLPKVMDIKYVHINLLSIINAERDISKIIGRYPKVERAVVDGVDVGELAITLAEISSSPEGLKDVKALATMSSEIAALLGGEDDSAQRKYAPITVAAANALLATTSRNIYVLGGGVSPIWSASDYDQNITVFTSNLEKAKKSSEGTQWPFGKVYSLALEVKIQSDEVFFWDKQGRSFIRHRVTSTTQNNSAVITSGASGLFIDKESKSPYESKNSLFEIGASYRVNNNVFAGSGVRLVGVGEMNALVRMVDEAKIGREMISTGVGVEVRF